MVTEAQMRILRRLDAFPDAMRAAWDVPRDLSQPGLSDHLGVVRSALHAPLVALQEGGLVEARMAHVIGGGSRRRNVYHISDEGRTLVVHQDDRRCGRRGPSCSVTPLSPSISEVAGTTSRR